VAPSPPLSCRLVLTTASARARYLVHGPRPTRTLRAALRLRGQGSSMPPPPLTTNPPAGPPPVEEGVIYIYIWGGPARGRPGPAMNFTGPGRPYPFLLPGPPPHHPILMELIMWGGPSSSAAGTRYELHGSRPPSPPWLSLAVRGGWRGRSGLDSCLPASRLSPPPRLLYLLAGPGRSGPAMNFTGPVPPLSFLLSVLSGG